MMTQDILHQFNMKVKTLLCHYSCGKTYLLLTLVYTMLLLNPVHSKPVTVHRRQSPRLVENLRTECHRSNSTCHFYDHCLEPMFPCGETGFLLDYAQKRCHQFAKLNHNDRLMSWLHSAEECFQRKLHKLVKQFHSSSSPPCPSTCLRLEREAIEAMNDCYNHHHNKLCHALSSSDESERSSTRQELERVMDAVRIGGAYYDSMVNRGVPETVRKCGHDQLADSLQSDVAELRLVICSHVRFSESGLEDGDAPSEVLDTLSRELDVPRSQFRYSGIDGIDRCKENPPNLINVEDLDQDLHIVTWFANHSHRDITSGQISERNARTTQDAFILFWELKDNDVKIRDNTTCGDGIRQAGEECDYTNLEEGCSLTCQVTSSDEGWYDCTTERLEPSACWRSTCGDGVRSSHEQCDDGNTQSQDGCSHDCRIESSTHQCTQEYNTTSVCTALPPPLAAAAVTPSSPTASRQRSSPSSSSLPANNFRDLTLSSSSARLRTPSWTLLALTLVLVCVTRTVLTQR